MTIIRKYLAGLLLTISIATVSIYISSHIPMHLISASVVSLILGMILNPLINKNHYFNNGIKLVSKQVLRLAIIIMGLTLSFSQVLSVGAYSLAVMLFTLTYHLPFNFLMCGLSLVIPLGA